MARRAVIALAVAGCARGAAPVLAPPTLAEARPERPLVMPAPEPVIAPASPAPPPPPAPVAIEPDSQIAAAPDPTCDATGDDDTFHTAHRGTLQWSSKPKIIRSGGSKIATLERTEIFIACPGDFDVMRIEAPPMSGWDVSMVVLWDPRDQLVVEELTPSGHVKPAATFDSEPGTAVVSSLFDEAARITAPARTVYRVRFQARRELD